jgi:phospho-N-acetylmuramoyl-pentapeptide-transferase
VFLLAFGLGVVLLPPFIAYMRQMKFGQAVREDGPESHLSKEGTPTMGGVIILFCIVIASLAALLWMQPSGPTRIGMIPQSAVLLPLAVLVSFGLLGFADDYLKAAKGKSLGLTQWQKLLWQFVIAVGFLALLRYMNPMIDTSVSAFGRTLVLGWLYWPLAAMFIVGMSNAVNITDGMDGLVSGLVTIAAVAMMSAAFSVVNAHTPVLLAATAGACLAFLWFNASPAKIFMGDTGSLALGGFLAAVAIQTGQEIALLIIGMLFVVEAVSVMAQVGYFKYSRRKYGEGRRIFKMAPLHHHFELSGWPEQKVVVRFWIIGLIFAALGVLSRGDWMRWMRF